MALWLSRAFAHTCVALLFATASAERASCEPIDARLHDGRIISGEIDSRTDETHLWLRRGSDEIEIQSGFPWSQLQSVNAAGKALSTDELRTLALRSGVAPARAFAINKSLPKPHIATAFVNDISAEQVRSVDIEVGLARWDAFVSASGLTVTIRPRNSAGALAPLRGELTLTLYGNVWSGNRYPDHHSGVRELARAHHIVRAEDFVHGPPTFQLPFDRDHPEFNQLIEPYGLVHARLGVNGQGVFEASDAFVRLRPFSPLRDRRTQFGQPRFFPAESTSWPYR